MTTSCVEISLVDRVFSLVDREGGKDLDIPVPGQLMPSVDGKAKVAHLAPSGSTILSSTTSAVRSL